MGPTRVLYGPVGSPILGTSAHMMIKILVLGVKSLQKVIPHKLSCGILLGDVPLWAPIEVELPQPDYVYVEEADAMRYAHPEITWNRTLVFVSACVPSIRGDRFEKSRNLLCDMYPYTETILNLWFADFVMAGFVLSLSEAAPTP